MPATVQKVLAASLIALLLVLTINFFGDVMFGQGEEEEASSEQPGGAPAPGGEGGATAPAADAAPLANRLAAADPAKGQQVAKKCVGCHTFEPGEPYKVGPNLAGVVGAPKTSKPGFSYSDALRGLGGTWTYEELDRFIAKPLSFAPGTKMIFAGVPSAEDRAAVIVYLKSLSPDAPPLPGPEAPGQGGATPQAEAPGEGPPPSPGS